MTETTRISGNLYIGSCPVEPSIVVPAGTRIQFVRENVFIIATGKEVGVYKLDGDAYRLVGSVDLEAE